MGEREFLYSGTYTLVKMDGVLACDYVCDGRALLCRFDIFGDPLRFGLRGRSRRHRGNGEGKLSKKLALESINGEFSAPFQLLTFAKEGDSGGTEREDLGSIGYGCGFSLNNGNLGIT